MIINIIQGTPSQGVNCNCPELHETTQRKIFNCDVIYKIERTEYDVIIKGYKLLQDD